MVIHRVGPLMFRSQCPCRPFRGCSHARDDHTVIGTTDGIITMMHHVGPLMFRSQLQRRERQGRCDRTIKGPARSVIAWDHDRGANHGVVVTCI